MMTIALILLKKKLNACVLPNTKAACRKEQATCEKKFICINDHDIKKGTTCRLLLDGKGCV